MWTSGKAAWAHATIRPQEDRSIRAGAPMTASADQKARQIYEFGPFCIDSEKELLLRDSEAVPIAPKAFQVLLVLVSHSKQVVTKDDLMKTVWPDTFVEEANLSRNIFLLRKALGESPQDHQYIVTVPGRGYRFAEDVRLVPDRELNIVAASHSRVEMEVRETRQWAWAGFAALVLVAVAIGSLFLLRRRQAIPLHATDSVLVADFANLTGDPVFDHALRQGLEVQLQQSPYLNLVSEDRIQKTLRLMGQAPETPLTGQIAREVCLRSGTVAMLEASIQNIGSQYVLNLRATNCRTGDDIDREQAEVFRKEEVLEAIGSMASRFRKRVGESGAMLQSHDVPLAEATTPSMEALKAYSLGVEAEANQGEETAIPLFKRAVELDPKFAMAYAYLAVQYGASGSTELATENIRKAYELSDRVSENERFFISAYYFGRAVGNQEKARQICEAWAATYPRELLPHSFLAGFIDLVLADYDQSVEEARKGISIAPDYSYLYFLLGENSLHREHLKDAEEALRSVSQVKVQYPGLLLLRYDLAFLRDDRQAMQQAVDAAQGKPESMDWMADRQAFSFANSGQLQKARVLSRQAVELAEQQGDPERAAEFAIRFALWEAFFGNAREAKQGAATALHTAKNREMEYGAAVALGLAGDSKRAQALADHLQSEYPEDTSIRFSYLPVIRAIVALNRGDSAAAITALEPAVPYELGSPRCAVVLYFGSLYPILLRGEAYLAAHQGPEATREFQKLLDHRGIMVGDAVSALAAYGLARSYALSGDYTNARNQYKQFLLQWKDADPDIPILKQAKAEYARLR